jgi:hypothetical protein
MGVRFRETGDHSWMDDADRHVLRFAAAHALIASDQVAVLTGVETGSDSTERVHRLVGEGLLSRTRIAAAGPDCLVISEAGLEATGSRLRVPVWEMRGVRGVRAAGWVWVRAQDGRIPGLTGVWSEREMIGHDLQLTTAGPVSRGATRPCGLRVGGPRSGTVTGLRYPDALLMFPQSWAGVHVALGGAAPAGLSALLTAYGLDDRFGAVVFLVERERVARVITAAALSAGVANVVSVQGWAPH